MTDEQQIDGTEQQEDAQGWRPTKGDRVVGTVTDITATDMGYGVYPIVTLKTATGETSVHAFHTVLRRELARRKPTIGDDLDITYLGKSTEGGIGGKGYDLYRVRSSKDVVGYDWDSELAGDGSATVEPDSVPIEPALAQRQAEPVAAPTVVDDDLPF